ncbi:putative membrane protein YccC [Mesonia hippocampi]|uniref:Putative membrane protein YccC n=1 Tax=Mesonia hippocampi TaxID=1628250 RepID=A0A840ER62_9FLAO|nr:FUSC family protein [Mesonia hippocampi]MBB4117836.1 putative membrane protein YccC [Mesonia hippocampi]
MMKLANTKGTIIRYFSSTDLSKALILAIAIIIPLLYATLTNQMLLGIGLTVGVFLVAPSNVSGNLRHRFLGILAATLLSASITYTLHLVIGNTGLQWGLAILYTFISAYISVYGFRASLVSFSGLLAITLSFSNIGEENFQLHSLGILIGGLWYILISTIVLLIRPKKHSDIVLGETVELTAKFLKYRAKLLKDKKHRAKLKKEQFLLQSAINEHHETLREALLSNRFTSGTSNSSRRKILILIELIDILELGLTHPINYKTVDRLKDSYPTLVRRYQDLSFAMSQELNKVAKNILEGKRFYLDNQLRIKIHVIHQDITNLFKNNPDPKAQEIFIQLNNVLRFERKQAQKIRYIQRVVTNIDRRNTFTIIPREYEQFLTPVDYSFKILVDNFSWSSPMFKHAIRLSLLMFIGLLVGYLFEVQNAYWILLTLIVILRPSYGLTKERSVKRIIGTLIGSVVAVGLVYITNNTTAYAVMAIISLVLAFSMIQKNYVGGAAFITINVILIYALLQPNPIDVIQYRIIDTIIGAGLAFAGNLLLFPSWEYKEINSTIQNALSANIDFLKEVVKFYHHPEELKSYKLKRKTAFLATGNLNGAFQRMLQEPKSKQKNVEETYEYTVLNYTFLSALVSLGSYIRSNEHVKKYNFVQTYTAAIIQNIEATIAILNQGEYLEDIRLEENREIAYKEINQRYDMLVNRKVGQVKRGKTLFEDPLTLEMHDLQLLSEQFKWLYEVSFNLKSVYSKQKPAIYEELF